METRTNKYRRTICGGAWFRQNKKSDSLSDSVVFQNRVQCMPGKFEKVLLSDKTDGA